MAKMNVVMTIERDQHDDRVVDGLGAGGPGDLAQLGPHLVDALAAEESALLDLGLRLAVGASRRLRTGSPSESTSPCFWSMRFCSRFMAMKAPGTVR